MSGVNASTQIVSHMFTLLKFQPTVFLWGVLLCKHWEQMQCNAEISGLGHQTGCFGGWQGPENDANALKLRCCLIWIFKKIN